AEGPHHSAGGRIAWGLLEHAPGASYLDHDRAHASRRRVHRAVRCQPPISIRAGWIDDRLDARYAINRKARRFGVADNVSLVFCEVDAIDLVIRHITLHPLDLRSHAAQDLARFF